MGFLDRLSLLPLLITFLVYPVVAWPVLKYSPRAVRMRLFAAVNVIGFVGLIFAQTAESITLTLPGAMLYLKAAVAFVCIYLLFVFVNYAVLRLGAVGEEAKAWFAFLFPLLFLCAVKYLPESNSVAAVLKASGVAHRTEFFVGISYLSFRLAHLAREVQNEVVSLPGLSEYLAYALFVPIISIGPIQPYSSMAASLGSPARQPGWTSSAWMRILIGLTKYLFLATIFNQFTYSGLLLDGHPHHLVDLLIALPAYTLYLYCNFSGFCDMVIGTSALLGIDVNENFDNPFLSRNMQEFWNRWHITLSSWFRDMMFTPMLKVLIRFTGPKAANHMVALTLFIVFITVGVWHGTGLNFLIFGVLQGVGLVTVHYYKLSLKGALSKPAFLAYQKSRAIQAVAVSITFAYFSMTLFFFANTIEDIRRIADVLR